MSADWAVLIVNNQAVTQSLSGIAAEYERDELRNSLERCEAELAVVRNILRDAPEPGNQEAYEKWYHEAACEYLETVE